MVIYTSDIPIADSLFSLRITTVLRISLIHLKTRIHFRIILSILYSLIPILKSGLQPTADYRFLIPSEKHSVILKMSVEFTIRYKEPYIMSIVPVMAEYG